MRLKHFLSTLALLCCSSAFAQKFDITNASRFFDVKIAVDSCSNSECTGKASFSFYKKGAPRPYQVINVPDTYMELEQRGKPAVNVTLLYDKQSAINVGDFWLQSQRENSSIAQASVPSVNIWECFSWTLRSESCVPSTRAAVVGTLPKNLTSLIIARAKSKRSSKTRSQQLPG